MTEVQIPTAAQLNLVPWHLVDRTRYETQHGRCARRRYLEFHTGPYSSGIRRQANSIHLVGGAMIHQILGTIAREAQAVGGEITDVSVRTAIAEAGADYHRTVVEQGITGQAYQDTGDALLALIEEQQNLMAGLTWCAVLNTLRPLFAEWEILLVEVDLPVILGCQCPAKDYGMGAAALDAHVERGCAEHALLFMGKPDLILRHRVSGRVAYVEYKTTGQVNERFLTEWPTKMQFALGGLAVEANLGVLIDEYYVLGLEKGRRQGSYNPETRRYDLGPDLQQSVCCYGYAKAPTQGGITPYAAVEWAPKWSYTDALGMSRRLGKGWEKTSVSHYPAESGETPVESWIKSLSPGMRAEQLTLIGPMEPKRVILEKLAHQIAVQELEWRRKLWEEWMLREELGELWQRGPEAAWESIWQDPQFQALLDDAFPQSFDCRRYGERYKCEFEKLCFLEGAWEAPLTDETNGYGYRPPHHELEQQQMRARGLEIALGDEGGEEG